MFEEKNKVLNIILAEYPNLTSKGVSITKQFISPTGREYNTYLLESNDSKFVAKGVTGQTASVSSLQTEWQALKILEGKNVSRLLFKDHQPKDYLLIEFIEGDSATDLLSTNKDPQKVFSLIGEALGQIHSVHVKNFGSLINPQSIIWSEYVTSKFSERLAGVKKILDADMYDRTLNLFHSLESFFKEEDSQPPVINHRDIYLENFIVTKDLSRAILIDFAMAIGGRPLFDVAKLFTTELIKKPEFKDVFLKAYQKYIPRDKDFVEKLTLYTILECVGFIGFNDKINNLSGKDSGIETLKRVVLREISF
jgi:Ser/Thr protein kinase RdoA (MazF antagonist)